MRIMRSDKARETGADPTSAPPVPQVLSNADIADRLASLAQLLSAEKENPYKVKAYQRAAATSDGAEALALVREAEALRHELDLAYLQQEVPRALEQSRDGLERVAKIVVAMKELSHPGSDAKTSVDLEHAVEQAFGSVQHIAISAPRDRWEAARERRRRAAGAHRGRRPSPTDR